MAKYIIGIDLGGTNLRIGLLNLRYKIIYKHTLSTKKFHTKDLLIDTIINSIQAILEKRHLKKGNILGIGLGLPGPIDSLGGKVYFFPNIPGWREVGLKGILERRLKIPVFIDNDTNLMGLAEYRMGAAKNAHNAVCITLGTGVGGGLIIDRQLYRGSSFAAGEIGHIPINEKDSRCNCGGIACLETYIGNNAILQDARKVFRKNISLEELSRLARKGNKQAIKIWLRMSQYLGIGLVAVVNLLNPDCIVIGGGVAKVGKILFDRVRQTIKMRAMETQAKAVKILKAKLGNDAGIIGAAMLVKESLSK